MSPLNGQKHVKTCNVQVILPYKSKPPFIGWNETCATWLATFNILDHRYVSTSKWGICVFELPE